MHLSPPQWTAGLTGAVPSSEEGTKPPSPRFRVNARKPPAGRRATGDFLEDDLPVPLPAGNKRPRLGSHLQTESAAGGVRAGSEQNEDAGAKGGSGDEAGSPAFPSGSRCCAF